MTIVAIVPGALSTKLPGLLSYRGASCHHFSAREGFEPTPPGLLTWRHKGGRRAQKCRLTFLTFSRPHRGRAAKPNRQVTCCHSICPYVLALGVPCTTHTSLLNGRAVRISALRAAPYNAARHHLLVSAKTSLSFAAERIGIVRLLDLRTRAAHVSTTAGFRHRCNPNPAPLFIDGLGERV